MSKQLDPVVIRVWKGDDSDVFALFPVCRRTTTAAFAPATNTSANTPPPTTIIASATAARAQGGIRRSVGRIARIGYNPRPIKRASPAMHRTCRELAKVA